MINFETNLNYLGPPPGVEELVSDNIAQILGSYVVPNSVALLEAVAEHFDVPTDSVTAGNGSTEIIFNLVSLLPRMRVVSLSPTFWEYEVANQRMGNELVRQAVNHSSDNLVDLESLDDKLKAEPANVFLCNPNNPTSSIIDSEEILDLAEKRTDSNFVIDETYLYFRGDFDSRSLSKTAVQTPNIHVVHSLSKFFACPGIRLGALVSSPEFVSKYKNAAIPYLLSPLAEIVGPWLLEQEGYIASSRQQHDQSRVRALELFSNGLGDAFSFQPPEANFIFAKANFNPKLSIVSSLQQRGLVVRDGNVFGEEYNNYIRFCIKNDQENKRLLDELKAISSENE